MAPSKKKLKELAKAGKGEGKVQKKKKAVCSAASTSGLAPLTQSSPQKSRTSPQKSAQKSAQKAAQKGPPRGLKRTASVAVMTTNQMLSPWHTPTTASGVSRVWGIWPPASPSPPSP